MTNSWSSTLKIFALVMMLFALYTYIHIYVKTLVLKNKQLERIGMLTVKSDKMMEHIFVVDENISLSLEDLSDMAY